MLRASPSQNLNKFQLECNWNLKENDQGQSKPKSDQFPIRIYFEFKENAQGQPMLESHQC